MEKLIEIVQWVKFKQPKLKQEVLELAKTCETKMDFINSLKQKYNLGITDASVVANNFYQKN